MNKTRRRAVQKHRAKDQKFAARRKAENEIAGGARARAQMQTPAAAARPKAASRARAEEAASESESSVAEPAE